MTAMQAALGHTQLDKLDQFIEQRRANARYLTEGLKDCRLLLPDDAPYAVSSQWKYVCQVEGAYSREELDRLLAAVRAEGVPAFPRYPVPLHRQPVFAPQMPSDPCPVADVLSERLFSLGVHPALQQEHLEATVQAVRKVIAQVMV